MAEEGSDSQEKTEDPSQRKIDKSLEEGKVLKSPGSEYFHLFAGWLNVDVCRSRFCQSGPAVWGSFFRFESGADLNHCICQYISFFRNTCHHWCGAWYTSGHCRYFDAARCEWTIQFSRLKAAGI